MTSPMLAHGAVDSGLFLTALTIGLLAALLAGRAITGHRRWLITFAAGGLGFQIFHAGEHVAQVAHWSTNPSAAPWLSPWAETGAHTLATVSDGRQATGEELLHLLGNLLFLAGLIAAFVLAERLKGRGRTLLRFAVWVQVAHVAEHVLVTATWLATGTPRGVTTGFGTLAAIPEVGVVVRIWAHFALNLVATVPAISGALMVWYDARSRRGSAAVVVDDTPSARAPVTSVRR